MKLRYILLIILGLGLLAVPVKLMLDSLSNTQVKAVEGDGLTQEIAPENPTLVGDGGIYEKTTYTPDSYVQPKYDPFTNKYNPDEAFKEINPTKKPGDSAPTASFTMRQTKEGFPVIDAATVGTEFTFTASQSTDKETKSTKLQVRWDFDGDGKPDTYYSYTKSVKHTYDKPGVYYVGLEVLDKGGNVNRTTKKVTIVENTPPSAFLIATPQIATQEKIFQFDTRNSSDSQYKQTMLKYRFDWNNDGIFDTSYDKKTQWRHKFDQPGLYRVVAEASDPDGLTDTYYQDVLVLENNAPLASFAIQQKPYNTSKGTTITYIFDGSSSSDPETPSNKLLYRWDFNYTGEDDIVYDTNYSTSPKYSGQYHVPGNKIVRLQVKDEDGSTDQAFQELTVQL
jgi:hypothetical protein